LIRARVGIASILKERIDQAWK